MCSHPRMGLFDRFSAKSKEPRAFDAEMVRRLDALAVANAQVRAGQHEASQVHLCPNVDAAGVVEANRPAVRMKVAPLAAKGDVWTLLASIDGATAHLRFLLDLEIASRGRVDASDLSNAPPFRLTLRRHPEYENGELARSWCLMNWRVDVDASFLSERKPGPIATTAVVAGTALTRGEASYHTPGSGTWALLKCVEPGPLFLAIDTATGDAELFPRRGDSSSYLFALDLLRVVA